MRTITVEVTADDIHYGRPASGYTCPIALAGYRVCETLGFDSCGVGTESIQFYEEGQSHLEYYVSAPLPEEARLFIRNFDGRRIVNPFQFQIKLKEED